METRVKIDELKRALKHDFYCIGWLTEGNEGLLLWVN